MKIGACVVFRCGVIALVLAAGSAALAQGSYPSRPVRIVVGFAPGGPSDIISRMVGAKMGELMGAQFVVENKTGAAGVLATQEVARAAPDGYTLLNTPLATATTEPGPPLPVAGRPTGTRPRTAVCALARTWRHVRPRGLQSSYVRGS